MLGLSASLSAAAASMRSFVKDNLKLYLDFKQTSHNTLKFPCEGSTSFDGDNDYIDVGDSDNLITGNNVTITVWVKNTGSTKAYIVQNQKGAGSTNMTLSVNTNVSGDSTAGEIAGLVWNGSAHGYIAYDGNIDDSAWHHLALTTTSSAQVLYLDGVSVATTSHTFANAASTDNTIIGNDGGNAFEHTGSIANVKIYNRALSRKEINQLMRETNPQ